MFQVSSFKFHDFFMEIKNLEKAARRIKKAIKEEEKILLFSDSDLDGATSLIILEETIKNLGGRVSICYFPDREKEGYGLSENALSFFKKYSPALLILLDCGIGNFKEVSLAKDLGFEVIIIEHHVVLGKVPSAEIVVNPKQKGDKYPFKFLATCGITFLLSREILADKISKSMENNFLELVSLGTIADKMPQKEDNEIFITQGLFYLPSTFRPGLKIFFKFFPPENYSLKEIVQKIVSVLQITETKNHLTESYRLLSVANLKEAEEMLKTLIEKSDRKRELIKEFFEKIEEKIFSKDFDFIFEGGKDFPLNLTGAIAGWVFSRFNKPTFIFSRKDNLIRGSIRSPQEIDSVETLKHCSSYLEIYGGHPQAAGFTVKKENLEKFKECLKNYFKS